MTRPLQFSGSTLKLNARTRPNGHIRVALCDSSGSILPGYSLEECVPFNGDAVRHEMRWSASAGYRRRMNPELFASLSSPLMMQSCLGLLLRNLFSVRSQIGLKSGHRGGALATAR